MFVVTDDTGKSVPEQVFSILVFQVDNKAPSVERGVRLNVERGGAVVLSNASIKITDIDTFLENIEFSLTQLPKHGDVVKIIDQNRQAILRPGIVFSFISEKYILLGLHMNQVIRLN